MKRTFSANRQITKGNFSQKKVEQAPPKPKPEWKDNLSENPYKISRAEQLQKKLNVKSKNEQAAKEELQAKYEQLKQGKIPKEYKPFATKGEKKFVANEAFIKNQDLRRQYENRSYVSQSILLAKYEQERALLEAQAIDDEINVRRETTEVKITYAAPMITKPTSQPYKQEKSEQVIPKDNNSTVQLSQDYDQILGLINQTKQELQEQNQFKVQFPQKTSLESEQEDHSHQYQRSYSQQILPDEKFHSYSEAPITDRDNGYEQEEDAEHFDYLDYKENEARLEKLRNQNLSLYSNYLPGSGNNQEQNQVSELDSYFSNLNVLIEQNKQQAQQQEQQNHKQQQMQQQQFCIPSGYQITPIKHTQSTFSGMIDSPKSLLPNYSELLGNLNIQSHSQPPQNAYDQQSRTIVQSNIMNHQQISQQQMIQQQQQQQQRFDYSKAPLIQDYEPQFNSNKMIMNPDQILSGMGNSNHNPYQSYQQFAFPSSQQQQQQQTSQPSTISQYQQQNLQAPSTSWIQAQPINPQVNSYQQSYQPSYQEQYKASQQNYQSDANEDQETARMREMLLNTQQEIDKIIQGTENISSLYNSSKQVTSSQQPNYLSSVMGQNTLQYNAPQQSYQPNQSSHNAGSSMIRGQQTVNEIPLNNVKIVTNPWANASSQSITSFQTSSENFNTLNSQKQTITQHNYDNDDDLKPRSYPFNGSSQQKVIEVKEIPFKNAALQQFVANGGGDSISLRGNLSQIYV